MELEPVPLDRPLPGVPAGAPIPPPRGTPPRWRGGDPIAGEDADAEASAGGGKQVFKGCPLSQARAEVGFKLTGMRSE